MREAALENEAGGDEKQPYKKYFINKACSVTNNLLLTEREGQYFPLRLELARLVSSLLYGTRAMLVLNLRAFENKKYVAYDRFHGNAPYGEIPTKREPIRTLGFAVPYNKAGYWPRSFSLACLWTSTLSPKTTNKLGQYPAM